LLRDDKINKKLIINNLSNYLFEKNKSNLFNFTSLVGNLNTPDLNINRNFIRNSDISILDKNIKLLTSFVIFFKKNIKIRYSVNNDSIVISKNNNNNLNKNITHSVISGIDNRITNILNELSLINLPIRKIKDSTLKKELIRYNKEKFKY
jgi:hypothetical protein